MICKGHARTNGGQLAAYLGDYLTHEKNERVHVLEIRGSQFTDLHRSLSAWESEAKRGKTKKALWHAQISPTPGEYLTREQQIEAVNILEKHLGYTGQPRATVVHNKDGREHIHVVWSRIDRETGKAKRDDFTHRKNCEAAREMEERFGLNRVETPRFRSDDKTKARKERREEAKTSPDYRDFQRAKRTGIDPRERRQVITQCWQQSDCGKAFRGSLESSGYILAHGNRRDFVVVDSAGDIHSLARQIKDAKVADVRERLKDVDPASIPKALHIQQQLRAAKCERDSPETPRPRPVKTPKPEEPQVIQTELPRSALSPEPEKRDPLEPTVILDDLTKQQSTFTKTDLNREVLNRLEAGNKSFGQDTIDRLVKDVRSLDDFISLGPDRAGRNRYTSRDMLETELLMRDTADRLSEQRSHAIKQAVRDASPTAAKLGEDQLRAFHHVTKDDGISMVVGYAGTGKSTMLGAAREAWEAAGYRVRGASLSSMAASSLEKGSGIQSRTLASMLWRIGNVGQLEDRVASIDGAVASSFGRNDVAKRRRARLQAERDRLSAQIDGTKLTARDVVVLDEAAMVGSRQMTTLLTAAHKAGAKIVLVGDAEQLQAIDAGGAFRALTERFGSVEITEIRRQSADWQRQSTKDFAQSFTEDAMAAYNQRANVHKFSTTADALKEMVANWTASRLEAPDKTQLMMAYTRSDVHQLNQEARERYRKEGLLSGLDKTVETEKGRRAFATGDRLYFLKNDLRLGVMNGSLGTVVSMAVDQQKIAKMSVRLDTGANVTFTSDVYNDFSHGYAATVHKAQGATVDRAHVLASKYMDRHSAYVGMSRHRESADLYYSTDDFRSYDNMVAVLSKDKRKDTTLDYLQRAEAAQQPDTFWDRVRKALPSGRKVKERARPAEAMLDTLSVQRPKKTVAERLEAIKAREAAEKLRAILGKRPDRKIGRTFGRTIH